MFSVFQAEANLLNKLIQLDMPYSKTNSTQADAHILLLRLLQNEWVQTIYLRNANNYQDVYIGKFTQLYTSSREIKKCVF